MDKKRSDKPDDRQDRKRRPRAGAKHVGTPEDASTEKTRGRREAARRHSMERAALLLSGELGYERMTVEALIERSESNRDRFYQAYRSKSDCYAAGYAVEIGQFSDRLLEVGAQAASWSAGMRGALEELTVFVAEDSKLARGLIAEVHVAGGEAMVKRREIFERFSRAIDRARHGTDPSRNSPPPITSVFILSGIEAALISALTSEESGQFQHLVPGLLFLSIAPFFGLEAARAEVRLTR